ncbi:MULTISPECIES: sialidase family protein [unclassified Imperialibacter]|uniref:sialidase family protein n=1 Tax=unclassified Imperialibacter TaxID=2629706 RepID=UPI001258E1C5|nr:MULTISPECIES: sialidase family protein [unclassified Imperialibacter]CAD5277127.1 BNR/Asp-box repeat-containing protein [Imperialibacter sp. 75]CAD5295106.1 BNR/Asp-box repeat-containing protein [Imperialibacter sp. 89]VVT12229.1 BNR/Asp-box repeat-containing protein [Imperialibacter sp. EC-SDR9]
MKTRSLSLLLLFPLTFACNEVLDFALSTPVTKSPKKLNSNKSVVANIVFKSTDGGQTWQDISEGLPENVQGGGFFGNDGGLYLSAENELYHSAPNSTAPFWKKEIFPDKHSSIAPGKTGIYAYNYWDGQFLKRKNATSIWWPMYTNFPEKQVRTIFESDGGAVFIGSDKGLFKSTDSGKTWSQVHTGAMNLVESNGVLMATTQEGIIRSSDGGENWELVISEGGVGIAVEAINGGFAAITYNTASETRRVRTSYDGGETWQAIDAGLPASLSITSIVQMGDYLFCGHPGGIFRSADKGQTWELVRASIGEKVFNLSVSGNVLYAVPRAEGC